MRRYKPWQLVLGYIVGLAVLIALLAVIFLAGVIIETALLIVLSLFKMIVEWLWYLIFWV